MERKNAYVLPAVDLSPLQALGAIQGVAIYVRAPLFNVQRSWSNLSTKFEYKWLLNSIMLNQYLILTMFLIGEIGQESYYAFTSTKLELREIKSLNDFIRFLQ